MEQVPNILEDTSTKMRSLVKRSDKFLTKDSELYEKTKLFSKVLYEVTKLIELEPSRATLSELIIEDDLPLFDNLDEDELDDDDDDDGPDESFGKARNKTEP